MGKADKKQVDQSITAEKQRSLTQGQQGINETSARVGQLTPRSDTERSDIYSGYKSLASRDPSADRDFLLGGSGGSSGSIGSGGGGGVPGGGGPSYLDTYRELSGSSGGFDPNRLGRIEGIAGKLGDTSGNYGDVNKSIGLLQGAGGNYGQTDTSIQGLQRLAATGGLDPGELERVNRPLFEEFERTGGYSDTDKANIRDRSAAAAGANFGALRDQMGRNRIASGQIGPGWNEAGFRLARQSSQDQAANARDTEISLQEKINAGRTAAANTIAGNQLNLTGLKNQARLGGYGTSGQLDIDKNKAIQDAYIAAGQMGLTRQQQIDAAMEAAAGIEQGNQGLINQTRLSAAGGLSQDELGRMSIGASSAANNAALDATNKRFLLGMEQENRNTGLGGMLSTYGASPSELLANQDLLRGYRGDVSGQQQGLINQQIAKGSMPGWTQGLGNVLGGISGIAGAAGGIAGGFGGFGRNTGIMKPSVISGPSNLTANMFPGYRPPGYVS